MMSERELAIADCKYAKSLGDTALSQHLIIWKNSSFIPNDIDEREYYQTIIEIYNKLGTDQCLLK